MENVLKFLMLAVGVIIVAVLVINVISLLATGKNVFDLGTEMLTESTSELSDMNYTQYDGSTLDGGRVVILIKNNWNADNMVSVCVCTKDGTNIMYDHDGAIFDDIANLKGFPTADAKKRELSKNIANGNGGENAMKCCAALEGKHDGIATFNDENGYGTTNLGVAGYINANAPFKGSIQRDGNENIRCITFVQQ